MIQKEKSGGIKEPGRLIINAITNKEIESYPKGDRNNFKVESVDSWLRNEKRRDKFIFYDSLKNNAYSNLSHSKTEKDKSRLLLDSFIRLPVTGLEE